MGIAICVILYMIWCAGNDFSRTLVVDLSVSELGAKKKWFTVFSPAEIEETMINEEFIDSVISISVVILKLVYLLDKLFQINQS